MILAGLLLRPRLMAGLAGLFGVAAAVSGGMFAWQTVQLAGERAAHADTRASHARQLSRQADAALEAVEAARAEEQRRVAALQGIVDETNAGLARARADAAAAGDAGRRLRHEIARATAAACRGAAAGGAAAAGGGQAASSPARVLADVQRRLDAAADAVAAFADASRAAGIACERAYGEALDRPAAGQDGPPR